MTETQARAIRQILVNGSASLTDAAVSMAPECLDRMTYDGSLINHGTRINWGGTIKRAAVDLWDREDNDPDNAPTLWEDVLYRKGYRIIPETITVGLAFSSGEIGWWGTSCIVARSMTMYTLRHSILTTGSWPRTNNQGGTSL